MIYLWPNSLLLAAIYGAIESGSTAIFGPIVGQWIEGMDYVKVLRLWLLCQNLSYTIAGGAVIKLLLVSDLKSRNNPVFATLVVLTNVAGAIGVLSTLGGTVLIERDWGVVMSEGHPPEVLTRMNSVIRGIDLSSKLLSPVITGLIISFVSLKASAITIAFWATITAWVEYWLLKSLYSDVPAIARSNERRILRSMTNPVEETDPPVSVSIVPGTEEGSQGPPRRTPMLKLLDRVSTSSFVGAWRIYINQEVVLPGVSLDLLFFTVLSFGTLMTATLQWEGIPTYIIGIGRGISATVGLAATVIYPLMKSHI
ncbi:Solute carrier family 40 member 1 [Raphanus sativus]|nr:Solute carrier family 40 member 1 [Raphanus sativus]